MTRINCVPPQELTDRHALAEYREPPRVFGLVTKAIDRGERPDDPRNPPGYVLGEGHVRFFYPRLALLAVRHSLLVASLERRGVQPRFRDSLFSAHAHTPAEWWGDWTPTPTALALNRARIAERLG